MRISQKTLDEFAEHFSSYYTVRAIEMLFDGEDIHFDAEYDPQVSGARRTTVKRYYKTLDFTKSADIKKILRVFELALMELDVRMSSRHEDYLEKDKHRLTLFLKRDGIIYQDGRLQIPGTVVSLEKLDSLAESLNIPSLKVQIQRMTEAVEDDPDLAIGTAKELTETTCKTILSERGMPYDFPDLIKLVGAVRRELKLTPDDISDGTKAEKSITTLLNNLGTVVQGLAELRNTYGTGHGKHGRARGLQPRHARLAVGASGTLATFLLETHLERTAQSSS